MLEERAFTRLGAGGPLPPERVDLVVRAVAGQVARARAAGVARLRVVATAGVRRAPGAQALVAHLEAAAGTRVDVVAEQEEARLAFRGATAGLADGAGAVAVVDVGGGSCEVAVGRPPAAPEWWISLPVGSALVAGDCEGDPPAPAALARARARVQAVWAEQPGAPPCARALAVGGSATSLRRLAGAELSPAALERALGRVCAGPARRVSAETGLDPARVELLPAGILLLGAAARWLGRPLEVARGGLREGVLLELAQAAGQGASVT